MATPNGDIYLLKNVPLTASYEHTIDFKTKDEQYAYFHSFTKKILNNYSYIRREREYIAVELPIADLDDVNYIFFRSQDGERLYYAFVTNKIYVNPTTTQLFYSVDVMQTYMFDYEWKASYIQQGHVDRWGADHKPIYSKTEEGLAYGTEYAIETAHKLQQSVIVRWALVTMVSIPNTENELTVEGFNPSFGDFKPVESAFSTFLLPIINDRAIEGVFADGAEIEQFSSYADFVKFMHRSALGNYVRSVSVLTYNPLIESEWVEGSGLHVRFKSVGKMAFTYFKKGDGTYINMLCLSEVSADMFKGTLARASWDIGISDSLPTLDLWEEVKKNPYTTKRDKRFESKLLCAPYRYNLLTDWRNAPVIFKNEYMTADVIEVMYSYAMSYNAPFRYWIKDYKRDPEGRYTSLSQPIAPELPIVSDQYYSYMLENKNTIQANLENAKISAITNTVQSTINGAIGGAVAGGGWGALGGAVTNAIATGVTSGINVNALIRSENAKQQDLQSKPDTLINANDSAFNIVDGNMDVTWYCMRICCENEEILAEIFHMTGYKVNRVDIPNTRSRVRFNYIQTGGANIVGSFNQDDLMRIKAIYDNGITIWHYSEKDFNPLDYSYENIEVNLI